MKISVKNKAKMSNLRKSLCTQRLKIKINPLNEIDSGRVTVLKNSTAACKWLDVYPSYYIT